MADGNSPAINGHIERSSPTQNSDAGSPSDPASSLRAAALLTLKSKRRRPAASELSHLSSTTGRPPPLAADSAMQLDYGLDDIPSSPPAATSEPDNTSIAHKSSSDHLDVKTGQVREEGEISDSEEVPANVNQYSPVVRLGKHELTSMSVVPPRARSSSSRSSIIDLKQESPPQSAIAMIFDHPPTPDVPSKRLFYSLDADHVRPGLESKFFSYFYTYFPVF